MEQSVSSNVKTSDLVHEFPTWVLPSCYAHTKSCGHVLHAGLPEVATNTLYLTSLEAISDIGTSPSYINVAALIIQTVLFQNPLWDISLQHQLIKKMKKTFIKIKFRQYSIHLI